MAGKRTKPGDESNMGLSEEDVCPEETIRKRLSDGEKNFAFRFFRDDGFGWTENVSKQDLYFFISDLNENTETDWRIKRKDNHPLQVVGITSEYSYPDDGTYNRRIEMANEIAEEENITVEEILDVDEENINSIDPVPTERRYEDSSKSYEFAIVDVNPDYTFDIENEFRDYSDILETEKEFEKLELTETH
jgi:hypothetical protein